MGEREKYCLYDLRNHLIWPLPLQARKPRNRYKDLSKVTWLVTLEAGSIQSQRGKAAAHFLTPLQGPQIPDPHVLLVAQPELESKSLNPLPLGMVRKEKKKSGKKLKEHLALMERSVTGPLQVLDRSFLLPQGDVAF